MSRVEHIGAATLYLGDCRELLSLVAATDDAVVSDPPYGIKWDGRVTRGNSTHGKRGERPKHYGVTIDGDDKPVDLSPLLTFPQCILWGFNHYPEQLRRGRALVWVKRSDDAFGSYLSDGEIAWCSEGYGVSCFTDLSTSLMAAHSRWNKGDVTRERVHPTQKPVSLMRFCIEQFPDARTILDPYMGSGSTGVAAIGLGRAFKGIEKDASYFDIACARIEAAQRQPEFALTTGERRDG